MMFPKGKLARFFDKVEFSHNGCWQWTAAFYRNGYACFLVKSRKEAGSGNRMGLAHRWAYQAFAGIIPEGMELDHTCRNRGCVNPGHLEVVTHQENNIRARASITHCRQGHELDGMRQNGKYKSRYCKTCNRERVTIAQERKRLTGSYTA